MFKLEIKACRLVFRVADSLTKTCQSLGQRVRHSKLDLNIPK